MDRAVNEAGFPFNSARTSRLLSSVSSGMQRERPCTASGSSPRRARYSVVRPNSIAGVLEPMGAVASSWRILISFTPLWHSLDLPWTTNRLHIWRLRLPTCWSPPKARATMKMRRSTLRRAASPLAAARPLRTPRSRSAEQQRTGCRRVARSCSWSARRASELRRASSGVRPEVGTKASKSASTASRCDAANLVLP